MSDLKVESKKSDSTLEVVLSGSINETIGFSEVDVSSINEMFIDFNQVTFINSTGINKWVGWMNELATNNRSLQIKFCNCPKIIIDQLNAVKGFLPINGVVESFWLPFYCDESDRREFVLLTRDKEFREEGPDSEEWVKIPDCDCSETNTPCEPDIMPAKYFAFMKARGN